MSICFMPKRKKNVNNKQANRCNDQMHPLLNPCLFTNQIWIVETSSNKVDDYNSTENSWLRVRLAFISYLWPMTFPPVHISGCSMIPFHEHIYTNNGNRIFTCLTAQHWKRENKIIISCLVSGRFTVAVSTLIHPLEIPFTFLFS